MTRQLDQGISITAGLVECSRVVIYLLKVDQERITGEPITRLIDVHEELTL